MSSDQLPKGYKQTEVGVIPKDWELVTIGDIGSVSSGGTPSRTNLSYWNGTIPWITTTQIGFNTIESVEQFITTEGLNNSAAKLFPPGTLLMAMYGQGKTRGKVAVLGVEASTNQACAAISLSENIHQNCVFHYLVSQYDAIRSLSNTGNQENLNGLIIKSIKIPLPAPEEQRSIAQALSDIDALIAALDKAIGKKRAIKTATMQQLLTGKKRLPGFGEGKGDRQTQVGVIPEDWEVKRLKHISPSQSVGLVINPSSYFEDKGTIPMLVGSQISENHINWESANRISDSSNALLPASRLAAGDLVTVRVGDPGVTAVVPPKLDGCNCASMMIVRQHLSFNSLWLCYVMNSRIGKAQIEHVQYGTAQKQFNISDAVDFIYPVPSLPEQRAIATVLSDMDAEIAALETCLAKMQSIKQGMMQELLTGRTRLV